MAATKEEIKELAEHIYDLDAEVYVHLGSSLGRVFNRDRERCVNELTELLTTRPQGHLVRSELGLIANMARTIEDKEERAMCMTCLLYTSKRKRQMRKQRSLSSAILTTQVDVYGRKRS